MHRVINKKYLFDLRSQNKLVIPMSNFTQIYKGKSKFVDYKTRSTIYPITPKDWDCKFLVV
ncbi:unnamed protein product, partial [Prunus brigantina]